MKTTSFKTLVLGTPWRNLTYCIIAIIAQVPRADGVHRAGPRGLAHLGIY